MTPAARIGLFMLAGLIILGIFIIKIEDIPVGERGDRLEVSARFPSVAGLDRNVTYHFAVVAVDLEGNVDSNVTSVSVTTIDNVAPAAFPVPRAR